MQRPSAVRKHGPEIDGNTGSPCSPAVPLGTRRQETSAGPPQQSVHVHRRRGAAAEASAAVPFGG